MGFPSARMRQGQTVITCHVKYSGFGKKVTRINGSGVFDDDDSGKTKTSYTNPVLLKCLLMSLVTDTGVDPSDITVYDVSRIFPKYMINLCNEGPLRGVNFVGSNAKWKQYPFNKDYTPSLFVSQDAAAIDSVGADFLMTVRIGKTNSITKK